MKIGYLMAIGYGEAGAKVIQKALWSKHGVDFCAKGERVYCIFGFCDIW